MLGVVWAQRSTERLWTLQNRTIMLLIETEITSWCINIGEGARTPFETVNAHDNYVIIGFNN